MPPEPTFVSIGATAEDIVEHRALADLTGGRYLEVWVRTPAESSVTRALYDRGWDGVVVVSTAETAEAFRRERPRDVVVQDDGRRPLGDVLGEHLTEGVPLHVLVLHASGTGRADIDLGGLRPWVLVLPDRWSALERELSTAREELVTLREAHDDALTEVVRWRGEVLARWSSLVGEPVDASAGRGSHEIVRLKAELEAMRSTVSWRVTAPLRALQQRRLREWR